MQDHRVCPLTDHHCANLTKALSAMSSCFMNPSEDGGSTTSLSSPFQCLTTLQCDDHACAAGGDSGPSCRASAVWECRTAHPTLVLPSWHLAELCCSTQRGPRCARAGFCTAVSLELLGIFPWRRQPPLLPTLLSAAAAK